MLDDFCQIADSPLLCKSQCLVSAGKHGLSLCWQSWLKGCSAQISCSSEHWADTQAVIRPTHSVPSALKSWCSGNMMEEENIVGLVITLAIGNIFNIIGFIYCIKNGDKKKEIYAAEKRGMEKKTLKVDSNVSAGRVRRSTWLLERCHRGQGVRMTNHFPLWSPPSFSLNFHSFLILSTTPPQWNNIVWWAGHSQLSQGNTLLGLMQQIKIWHLLALHTTSTPSTDFLRSHFLLNGF